MKITSLPARCWTKTEIDHVHAPHGATAAGLRLLPQNTIRPHANKEFATGQTRTVNLV